MFIVTKQLFFPQRRAIELAPLPGVPEQPPPPLIVTLEIGCDTDEAVGAVATLGEEVVRAVGKHLQGRVVFSQAARRIFNELYLTGLRAQTVTVTPTPGFSVKYEANVTPPIITEVLGEELAS